MFPSPLAVSSVLLQAEDGCFMQVPRDHARGKVNMRCEIRNLLRLRDFPANKEEAIAFFFG